MTVSQKSLAGVLIETTDAGNTIPTAIVVGPGITEIQGSLSRDEDLWGFNVFSAETVQLLLYNSPFDENLILFDSLGRGIAGNDDIGRGSASPGTDLPPGVSGLDSEIVAFLDPGLYYVAAGRNNMDGLDSSGSSFITNDSGLLSTPTTRTLASLRSSGGTGEYTLAINRSTANPDVPEPTSCVIMGLLGTMGLVVPRRRKSR